MSKFCPKCGTALDDNAVFCTSCGENMNANTQNFTPAPESAPESNTNPDKKLNIKLPAFVTNILSLPKKKLMIYGGIALAAIVAIIVAICLIFPSPKMVVNNYMNGILHKNAGQIINCYPSFMWEDNDEKKEAKEDLQDLLEDLELDEYDKVSFEIIDVNKLSKSQREYWESRLESYEDNYDKFKASNCNLKTAKEIEVKITIKDGGDTRRTTVTFIVINYRGIWKIFSPLGLPF